MRSTTGLVRAHASGGYVLLFVMAVLVLLSFGALRLSQRADVLRDQTATSQDVATARTRMHSAWSQARYWLATRPLGFATSGFTDETPVRHDGRTYRMTDGGYVAIQDDRGLLPLNMPNRDLMLPTFMGLGASFEQASRLIAVLEDYIDEDDLRRINGAESREYLEAGLPLPRNRRLMLAQELERLPVWRDLPELRAKVTEWGGLRTQSEMNPNTAPLELLKLAYPRISDSQWELLDTMRQRQPFPSHLAARAATGIPFEEKLSDFQLGGAIRLRVWAPGSAQALEYNFWLLPSSLRAPWHIHSVGRVTNPLIADGSMSIQRAARPIEDFPTIKSNSSRPAEPDTEAP